MKKQRWHRNPGINHHQLVNAYKAGATVDELATRYNMAKLRVVMRIVAEDIRIREPEYQHVAAEKYGRGKHNDETEQMLEYWHKTNNPSNNRDRHRALAMKRSRL